MKIVRIALVTLAATLAPFEAHANGRFPDAQQLVVNPENPNDIAVQTTYGFIHSLDGGTSWQNVSAGLPEWLWVSRIEVSKHDTATALVALNGYRWDHFESYLYRTTNYGKTWTRLGATGDAPLPAEPINVVRQENF